MTMIFGDFSRFFTLSFPNIYKYEILGYGVRNIFIYNQNDTKSEQDNEKKR